MLELREVEAPYPGLRPFESYEGEIFFGRETHTDALVDILEREHFLAVIGPSGLGKSSLVRAGLLPALAFGTMGTGVDWRIAVLRPGNRPLQRLAQALLSQAAIGTELIGTRAPADPETATAEIAADVASIEAELNRGPLGLAHVVNRARRPNGKSFNLLVLVDQFEEIFTYADAGDAQADESEAFINLLLQARADHESRIHITITMRTDFLGNCVRFLDLPEAINKAQYLTPRLTRAQLERAIVGPARVFGGDVDADIVPELINAVADNPDQLPILQHALARMWVVAQQKNPGDPTIDRIAMDAVGGIKEALNKHAHEVYSSLTNGNPGQSDRFSLAAQLFRAITERRSGIGGGQEVRRPQTLARIADWTGDPWQAFVPIIEAFSAKGVHFLQHGRDLTDQSVIDISHEALIRQWKRLRGWVAIESERATAYVRWRQLEADYREGRSGLLVGVDLARAIEWLGATESSAVSRWQPSSRWARRYAQISDGTDHEKAVAIAGTEFDCVKRFIQDSDNAARRIEREVVERKEHEQRIELERLEALAAAESARATIAQRLHERAEALAEAARERSVAAEREQERLAALAEAERLKALAAEREREQAAAFLNASKRQSRRLGFVALLALLFAVTAAIFAYKSKEALRQSTSLRLAIEGTAIIRQERSGSTLKGVLIGRAAHGYQPGGEAYHGLLLIADYLRHCSWLNETQSAISTLAVSSNGKIVTGSLDSTLQLWATETGKRIGEPLRGNSNSVETVAFSPDGKLIASGSDTLQVWDSETRKPVAERFRGHSGFILSIAFSPDGKRIVSGSADRTLRLWDVITGKPIGKPFEGHTDFVHAVAFSPDGKRIASGSADHTVRLWNTESGSPISDLLIDNKQKVSSVAFNPDGKSIASASGSTVRLWNAETGKQIGEPLTGHTKNVSSIAFSPDGKYIVAGSEDGTLRLWDTQSGKPYGTPFVGHTDIVKSVAFSPDGKYIVSGSLDSTLRLWSVESGMPYSTPFVGHTDTVTSVAFSPDGKSIASASGNTVRLWNAETSKQIGEPLTGHTKNVSSIAFSPDGKHIVSGGEDGTLRLWDTQSGKPYGTPFVGHTDTVTSVAFSPDGKYIVSGSVDRTLRLWSFESGKPYGTPFMGHTDTVTSVAFSPDGKYIVSGSRDYTLRLWETRNAKSKVLTEHTGRVTSVAFSPDGGHFVSGSDDKTIRLWETRNAKFKVLTGHKDRVTSVAFSPDGRHIVSGSADNTLRLWDAQNAQPTGDPLVGHVRSITSVVFNPGGKVIVAASDDTLRRWPMPEALEAEVCAKVLRNMTKDEWKEWVGDLPYRRQCHDLPGPPNGWW